MGDNGKLYSTYSEEMCRERAALNAQIRNNGQGNADRAPAKTGYIIDDCYFLLHYTAPFALYCITKSRELQQIRNSASNSVCPAVCRVSSISLSAVELI